MAKGWIKIHRRILDDPIFSSEKGLKIWLWCLLRATHKKEEFYFGRVPVKLTAGQFVFGRTITSKTLGISPSTLWWWMCQLDSCGYIDIRKTSKYSVITILNWDKYQTIDSTPVDLLTTDGQQMDTYNKGIKNGEKPLDFKNKERGEKDPNIVGGVVQTSYIKNLKKKKKT